MNEKLNALNSVLRDANLATLAKDAIAAHEAFEKAARLASELSVLALRLEAIDSPLEDVGARRDRAAVEYARAQAQYRSEPTHKNLLKRRAARRAFNDASKEFCAVAFGDLK